MLFADLVGSPLHSVQFDVLGGSLIVLAILFDEWLQVVGIIHAQLGHSLLPRWASQQLLQLLHRQTFSLYFILSRLRSLVAHLRIVVDESIDVHQIFIDMQVCGFTFDDALLVAGLDAFGVVLGLLAHQQQTIVYNTISLFMHLLEITNHSKEISIVHRTRVLQTSRSRRYEESEESEEPPELMIYEILLSLIRKQTRKPFQLFKQFYIFSEDEESSIEVTYKHPRYELQIIEENIRSACTLVRQRMLVDGFISIKTLYQKKIRIEEAYYNEENLVFLHTTISSYQSFLLKWEGFGRLYEHFRGNRLLKLNLSKIEALSNDYTSKELEDFHPFLSQRRQTEVIHSYLIDRSSENDSSQLHPPQRYGFRNHEEIKQHEEEDLEEGYNRSLRKSRTEYDIKKAQRDELQAKIMITHKKEEEKNLHTHKKEIQRAVAGSTIKVKQEERQDSSSQQIYLIRDYKTKGKKEPSNFIKVPVLSENVKIVQILTGRKKTHKERRSKAEMEIYRQICQNCRFCVQMRQRKEMLRVVEQRFECITIHTTNSHTFLHD